MIEVVNRKMLDVLTRVVDGVGDIDIGMGEGVREVDGTMSSDKAEVVGRVPVGDEEYGGCRKEKYLDWKVGGARA